MSDDEGGDALHDNVLIDEGEGEALAEAEDDATPATEARKAKEERRRRKEKKRKSEAADDEGAEQVALARNRFLRFLISLPHSSALSALSLCSDGCILAMMRVTALLYCLSSPRATSSPLFMPVG